MNWDSLVEEHLLKSPNILNGIALVSFQGHIIDCRGELTTVSQTYWNQFKDLFTLKQSDDDVVARLTMPSTDCDEDDVFIVHRQGDTSVYATAKWNARGLVACLLPHGVLVCTYQAPQSAHTVSDLVERFSELLRA